MSIRKTYQSLGAIPLSVDLRMGDSLVSCNFTGGMKHPVVRYPVFSTMDEQLQKIMEMYPGYKKSYDLVLVESIDEKGMSTECMDPSITGSDDPKKEILVKNLGAAKAYLKQEFNVTASPKSKREDVNELFAQQGIKLILETDKKS